MRIKSIIVGADGTDGSKAAVRWAAREAYRLDQPLLVTHVYDWDWREARYEMSNDDLDKSRRHAEASPPPPSTRRVRRRRRLGSKVIR